MNPLRSGVSILLLAGVASAHTVTQTGGTNIRSGPAQGDRLMGVARHGCIVRVLKARKDGWRRIDRPVDGWIRSATLKDTPHAVWIGVKEAAVRAEPDADAKTVKTVKDGAEVRTEYSNLDGGWVRISKPAFGWILRSKLTYQQPGPPRPDVHHGLAWSLYVYAVVKSQFPRVTSMGIHNYREIAGTNTWSEHAWANAVDIGVPSLAYGDQVYRYLNGKRGWLNIDNLIWRQPSHYNHLHVDFNWAHGSTPPRL